ncbi:hypothetical protein ACTD5D_39800 [Nocardia takedensis]|uniref:hypothetical protein n=1 Tax=Nocardia takedensis TaxID=259390 RepID=UPI003F758E41
MAEPESTFTEDNMVVVDGIRYRPDDAPKPTAPPAKKAPAKKAPPAENKARTAEPAADAGDSGTVATK